MLENLIPKSQPYSTNPQWTQDLQSQGGGFRRDSGMQPRWKQTLTDVMNTNPGSARAYAVEQKQLGSELRQKSPPPSSEEMTMWQGLTENRLGMTLLTLGMVIRNPGTLPDPKGISNVAEIIHNVSPEEAYKRWNESAASSDERRVIQTADDFLYATALLREQTEQLRDWSAGRHRSTNGMYQRLNESGILPSPGNPQESLAAAGYMGNIAGALELLWLEHPEIDWRKVFIREDVDLATCSVITFLHQEQQASRAKIYGYTELESPNHLQRLVGSGLLVESLRDYDQPFYEVPPENKELLARLNELMTVSAARSADTRDNKGVQFIRELLAIYDFEPAVSQRRQERTPATRTNTTQVNTSSEDKVLKDFDSLMNNVPVTDDSLTAYLRDIRSIMKDYPLLTIEKEFELAQRIEYGRVEADKPVGQRDETVIQDGRNAREIFINSNLRGVVFIARKMWHRIPQGSIYDLIDIIQQGNEELIKSVDKYNWRLGNRFGTFGFRNIELVINNVINRNMGSGVIPAHIGDKRRKIISLDLAEEEVAEMFGIELSEAQEYLKMYNYSTISLNAPQGENYSGEEFDSLEDSFGRDDPRFREIEDTIYREQFLKAIGQRGLTPRELEAYEAYIRLDSEYGEEPTKEEIGKKLRIGRERVRQLLGTGRKTLRSDESKVALQEFFDTLSD